MNKNSKVLFAMLFFLLGSTLAGCGNTSSSATPLQVVAFNVDETRVDLADIGGEYTVAAVAVEDDKGKFYQTTITVKDPDGLDVPVNGTKFTCSKVGEYTVTYTVTLDDGQVIKKSYKVSVIDVSEPTIVTSLKAHNITMVGSEFDLSTISLEDNSNETIEPTITVSFNGEDVTLTDDVVSFTEKGTYTITVAAEDSSENSVIEEFNVYTVMDYESEKYYNNEWYPTEISDKQFKSGSHAYQFGMFANAPSWFNDYSMLGDVYLLDAEEAQYVSFWLYFDGIGAGMENVSAVQNARYNEQTVYDIYGQEIALDWQNKINLPNNKWYRFVINMTEFEMWGDTKDKADANTKPIDETLNDFAMFFGAWDNIAGNNAAKSMNVYIDDVRLLGEEDDEVYEVKPEDPYELPEHAVADFESSTQVENFLPAWNTTVAIQADTTFNESKGALVVTPYTQWSDISFKNSNLTLDSIAGYDAMTMKMYVEDTSADNVYDANTKVVIDAQYATGPILKRVEVAEPGVWFDFSIPLGDYQEQKISEGLKMLFWKVANGKNYGYNQDVEYNGSLKIYIDDIYLVPSEAAGEFVPGETEIVTTYNNIFAKQLDGLKHTNAYGDFSFYHGSVENQKPFIMISDSPYQLGIETGKNSESADTFAEGWRFFFGANGAFGYRFDATEHCFVKVVEQTEGGNPLTAGWIECNMGYAIIGETINVLSYGWVSAAGTLGTDYIELQAGESFCYQFDHVENRNIANPPSLVVTNAVAA